ncbi:tryptophan synthase beta subunit-like PLP-dependent enzyme [Xylariomycetidae sp. FL0641]|nr:tryptophan synthase beta subunit-like PLP-dependent enzyme [Xylariomycetidae sp. FL0641]
MGSADIPEPQKLYIETPCIPSAPLSRAAGCNIFLKLENLQPSGSFKSRGIGRLMQRALAAAPSGRAHFYSSSGGNAGLACAVAAAALAQPCTVVCPTSTPAATLARIRAVPGDVAVHQVGENWARADEHLREVVMAAHAKRQAGEEEEEEGGKRTPVYVPPFDHPHVWEGASSIVDELVAQTAALTTPPPPPPRGACDGPLPDPADVHTAIDAIVCAVGGGGLLNGIMEGVARMPGPKPTVLAVETRGAASLDAAVRAGELVTLPAITSVATSLGAPRVAAESLRWARARPHRLVNAVVEDRDAVRGALRLADEARMLVEVACGAAVAPVYTGLLREKVGAGLADAEWSRRNVVIVVCGGSIVSLDMLREYRERFGVE